MKRKNLFYASAICCMILLISCAGKKASENESQNDSLLSQVEEVAIVAEPTVNEADSIKKFLYNIYFISSWLDETDEEGEPVYSTAMLNEFKKYGINKELPGIFNPKAYKDYVSSDFKSDEYSNGFTAIWQGSKPDLSYLYDYNIDPVNFEDENNAIAVIVNGQSVREEGPYITRIFHLKKEDGKWKISKIENAG